MLRQRTHHLGPNVSPQAIFWRPIYYFALSVTDGEDELDRFKFISFSLDNNVFDLRVYLAHPQNTVTLYFPLDMGDLERFRLDLSEVINALGMPEYAVAWKRSDGLNIGELKRRNTDRLRENEARLIALKIAATFGDKRASTAIIKERMPHFFDLSPADLKRSETRPNENMWQQIVRNVKVHHIGQSSIFSKGWANTTANGIELTAAGLDYLKSIGFSSD